MGKEIQVSTLEEMCSLMYDNTIPAPKEKEENWIFTFGCGHKHSGHYVKISGSFYEARQKMFDKFGDKWCFQYSEEEWERMKNDPKRSWNMETELEDYDG